MIIHSLEINCSLILIPDTNCIFHKASIKNTMCSTQLYSTHCTCLSYLFIFKAVAREIKYKMPKSKSIIKSSQWNHNKRQSVLMNIQQNIRQTENNRVMNTADAHTAIYTPNRNSVEYVHTIQNRYDDGDKRNWYEITVRGEW